jgi:hypothetical protein
MFGRSHIESANGRRDEEWRGRPAPASLLHFGPPAQPLELVAGPADQEGIDTLQSRRQFRLVEVTVVADPALDIRSKHPRQISQGFVGPMVQRPPSNRLPNCLQRLRTGRWQEGSDVATSALDRVSRTKGVSEKVKRLDREVAAPVRILAIDELRLRRMENQSASPQADLQSIPEPAGFFFASAMADDVVRVSLERDGGEAPRHPHVENIVQEQICQNGADHPTLRRSAIRGTTLPSCISTGAFSPPGRDCNSPPRDYPTAIQGGIEFGFTRGETGPAKLNERCAVGTCFREEPKPLEHSAISELVAVGDKSPVISVRTFEIGVQTEISERVFMARSYQGQRRRER